jgi:hypothetical protein
VYAELSRARKKTPAAAMRLLRERDMTDKWPFEDVPTVAVVTLKSIIRDHKPILYVYHDEGLSGWQFLDGGPINTEDARIVSLKSMLIWDPTLAQIADLPMGWSASRKSMEEAWSRKRETEPSVR